MEQEEIIMLTRSILASKKHGITIQELENEYYELNGSKVPYRKLGFDSLAAFLQSHPDKFKIEKDYMNQYTIRAVIDAELQALARLVAGQKSSKKKKSKPKAKPLYRRQIHNPSESLKIAARSNNYFNSNTNNGYSNGFSRDRTVSYENKSISSWGSSSNFSSNEKAKPKVLPQRTESTNYTRRVFASVFKKSLKINFKQSDLIHYGSEDLKASQFIDNAAYFLKENDVIITHYETCSVAYLRLVGENFSVKFDKMFQRLNEDYKVKKEWLESPEIGKFCVAYDALNDKFHRVQIKKLKPQRALCFFLDEGRTTALEDNLLFKLKNEYLDLKFQAIKVELLDFDQFENNEYVLKVLRDENSNKKYLAKRTQSTNPIQIVLYDGPNSCLNENILNNLDKFIPTSLKIAQTFEAVITYFDEDLHVSYLQFCCESKENFDTKMSAINRYYIFSEQEQSNLNKEKNFDLINKRISESQNLICFAKYSDQIWYRAKILKKEPNENKVMVHFIDFGNIDKVAFEDIRLIENKFTYMKFLPPQANSAFIFDSKYRIEEIKKLMYDAIPASFKVKHVNSSGIASVELVAILSKSSSSSDLLSDNEPLQQCNQILSQLKIESKPEIKEDPNEIASVFYNDFEKQVLEDNSIVHVLSPNNPSDFVVFLNSNISKYDLLKQSLNEFYSENGEKYTATEFVNDRIYVCKDDQNNYHRVKIFSALRGIRVYQIDTGTYDIVSKESVYYITKGFIKLGPLAFKASLAKVNFDQTERWSDQSKEYFKLQLKDIHFLRVQVHEKNAETGVYKLDLFDTNLLQSSSLSHRLLKNGFAISNQILKI